jgi:GH18 family chitinase
MALEKGIGGLMIWEIGQDCRLKPVPREDTTHQRTCQKDSDSLLVAITKSLEKSKRIKRYRAEDWVNSHTEL